jgi:hypothetical protein
MPFDDYDAESRCRSQEAADMDSPRNGAIRVSPQSLASLSASLREP